MSLASHNRMVIAPDYHGYGESDRPPEMPHVSIEDYARTIWEALDVLGVQKVDLLGHHTGSKVAIEMAVQFPERVNAICLISVSITPGGPVKAKTFSPLQFDEEGQALQDWWRTLKKFYDPELSMEALSEQFAESLRPGPAFHWGFRAAYNYNTCFAEKLKKLDHPITVINPGDDLVEITPHALEYIQHGKLIQKQNWKHGFLSHHMAEAVEVVLSAIDGNS